MSFPKCLAILLLLAGPTSAQAEYWEVLSDTTERESPPDTENSSTTLPTHEQGLPEVSANFSPAQPEEKTAAAQPCSKSCINPPTLPVPDFKSIPQGEERINAFTAYFGPQAIALQKATGYPASLMLAQWAEESGWGSSPNYRKMNNIAGHRCWKDGEKKATKIVIPGREKTIVTTCSARDSGGILYLHFENPLDSTLDYVNNLMYEEDTADAYKSIRAEVNKAKPGSADWHKLMRGLRNYCPLPQYQKNVPSILKSRKFEQWEKRELCNCS